jgi:hypothetical protein
MTSCRASAITCALELPPIAVAVLQPQQPQRGGGGLPARRVVREALLCVSSSDRFSAGKLFYLENVQKEPKGLRVSC